MTTAHLIAADAPLRESPEGPRTPVRDDPAPSAPPAQRVTPSAAPETEVEAAGRLLSIDAYRGLVMALMVSAGLRVTAVVQNMDNAPPQWRHLHTSAWDKLAFHTDHVEWAGCALWDLIQPSFMFLVGTALAFSLASRRAKGQPLRRMLVHAVVRSVVLVLLSVLLISNWSSRTNWAFTNVLAQIGLGYPLLFLVAWLRPRWQFAAAGVVLAGYWGAFALYPKPAANLDLAAVHLPADWHRLEGFASHWEKNTNFAARADQWLLNRFPRPDGKPYAYEPGGYQTLNFVPSLATMIFGLLAGEWLRGRHSGWAKVGGLLAAGAAALAGGWALGHFGICPVVKRIWTPSWAVYSAGWSLLLLAGFYCVLDVLRWRRWEYPLVVVGANSIAIYCASMLLKPWVRETLKRHLGSNLFEQPGRAYGVLRYEVFGHVRDTAGAADAVQTMGKLFAPMADAGLFLLLCWLLCWWMYRRRIFIKI